MKSFKHTLLALALVWGSTLVAEPEASEGTEKKEAKVNPNAELTRIARLYGKDAMPKERVWDAINALNASEKNMSEAKQIGFAQFKAEVLFDAGFPVIAATYAADALKKAQAPLNAYMKGTWQILWKVSRKHPLPFVLEDLARTLKLKENPPYFSNNWNYILANAYAADGKDNLAMESYGKITMGDRYYMPSQYQIAMIHLNTKEEDKAEIALKSILYKSTRDVSPLPYKDKLEMWNYANMALGRLYYQKREFLKATKHYRKVTHTSPLFYNALFEQSWSLFMGGHPLHSLGTLYDVQSPYFKDEFNPEAKILEAVSYYWMCRYEDSRNSLADFADSYAKMIEGLGSWLQRHQFTPDGSYQLFENLISGVSSEALGLPRNILTTVAQKDSMLLVRDQLATAVDEAQDLQDRGVFGSKKALDVPTERIANLVKRLKTNLGQQYIVELKAEKDHFEELYSQSQFLYVELLMSEKEQLLGRELHVSNKLTKGLAKNIRGWARDAQSWKGGRGDEYWWDEVGFHIVSVTPQCQGQ